MRNGDTIVPDITLAIRWIARVLSIVLVILIAGNFIFTGWDINFSHLKFQESVMNISLLVAVAGLVLGWIWEGLGGLFTIAGLLTFSIINYSTGGDFPWAIWILALPAVLFLIYWRRVN